MYRPGANEICQLLETFEPIDERERYEKLLTKSAQVGEWWHPNFARIVTGPECVGFLTAEIISEKQAAAITASASAGHAGHWTDAQSTAPNAWSERSIALLISSTVWRGNGLTFLNIGMEHLVRWFEGTGITSVLFKTKTEHQRLIEPILQAIEPEQVEKISLTGGNLYRIRRPWKPIGLTVDWGARLFRDYPEPENFLSMREALIGKFFYEYNFDWDAAVQYGLRWWSVNPRGNRMHGCSNVNQWRSKVAKRLKLNDQLGVDGKKSHGVRSMQRIQKIIEDNPNILIGAVGADYVD